MLFLSYRDSQYEQIFAGVGYMNTITRLMYQLVSFLYKNILSISVNNKFQKRISKIVAYSERINCIKKNLRYL